MQNITRTLTEYKIMAYDLEIGDNGQPFINIIAECTAESASMTKSLARAELAMAAGKPIPRGVTVKWEPVSNITYAVPLDTFLANATVIKKDAVAAQPVEM